MSAEPSSRARVWVLNPDAERELAGALQSTARHIAQMRERAAMFDCLTLGEPSVLAPDLGAARFEGQRALLWCPTENARAAAAKSGLSVGLAPSLAVLRRVNDKRFPSEACPHLALRGRRVIAAAEELDGLTLPLRLKRPFGFAGKGQRTIEVRGRSDDRRWVDESLRQASLVAEPHLASLVQVSCHGIAGKCAPGAEGAYADAGDVLVGRPVALATDTYGAPVSVVRATLDSEVERSLLSATREVARRLEAEGYFGPFGCDYALVDAAPYLLDLNARFTLGFSVGFGAGRGAALARLEQLSFPESAHSMPS